MVLHGALARLDQRHDQVQDKEQEELAASPLGIGIDGVDGITLNDRIGIRVAEGPLIPPVSGGSHPSCHAPDPTPDVSAEVGYAPDDIVHGTADAWNSRCNARPPGKYPSIARGSANRSAAARPVCNTAPTAAKCILAPIPMASATTVLHPVAMNFVELVARLHPLASDVTQHPDIARRVEPVPPIARLRGAARRPACRGYRVSPGPSSGCKKGQRIKVEHVRKAW